MANTGYEIIMTQPTVYADPIQGIVNGVLIRFRLTAYDEVHEVRIAKMDAKLAEQAIQAVIEQRDALASLG